MMDEPMHPWLGLSDRDTRGMPHQTKIERKLRGVRGEAGGGVWMMVLHE
jgi:hypothetical protein